LVTLYATATQSGRCAPALFPAFGKMLVAHQSDPAPIVEAIIASATQAVGLHRERVVRELAQLRHDGYASAAGGVSGCRDRWATDSLVSAQLARHLLPYRSDR
jgi:DNA-binding IclR family transcriptional regulator